jgi:G3E family GTPase
LNTKVQPDVLIMESTGVANPSDLKRDLALPIFNGRFQFKEQFCIIDAAHFLYAYQVYASLEKQIATSTAFIINKTDMASPETITQVKEVVSEFHPDPLFFDATYADIPMERFFDFDLQGSTDATIAPGDQTDPTPLTNEQLDQFIDELLDSPELEITPPDALMSVAYHCKGDNLEQVRTIAQALPTSVVRAKGFIQEDSQLHIFNYVMGDWTIVPSPIAQDRIKHKNIVVFIGPPESMQGIAEAAKTGEWTSKGVFQPYFNA